jgi:dihydrofolate reductase
MRKLIVTEFVSLDGVMQAPGGGEPDYPQQGWSFTFDRGSTGDKFKLDELMESEATLLGRVTYDGFAAAWPQMKDEAGFADKMNSMPKYVVSSTLTDPTWANTTVLDGDPIAAVRELRAGEGGPILVHGSAQLTQALIASDLVDELHLMVFPIVLGSGKKVFGDAAEARRFRLTKAEQAGEVLITVYEAARD